jgi:hypothetical protein
MIHGLDGAKHISSFPPEPYTETEVQQLRSVNIPCSGVPKLQGRKHDRYGSL